jgi:hypothetical protein
MCNRHSTAAEKGLKAVELHQQVLALQKRLEAQRALTKAALLALPHCADMAVATQEYNAYQAASQAAFNAEAAAGKAYMTAATAARAATAAAAEARRRASSSSRTSSSSSRTR